MGWGWGKGRCVIIRYNAIMQIWGFKHFKKGSESKGMEKAYLKN